MKPSAEKSRRKPMPWPDNFAEALTGFASPANPDLCLYLITSLRPRNAQVLLSRFQEGKIYRLIGDEMGITGTRARQLAEIGLRQLREKMTMEISEIPRLFYPGGILDPEELKEAYREKRMKAMAEVLGWSVEEYKAHLRKKQIPAPDPE